MADNDYGDDCSPECDCLPGPCKRVTPPDEYEAWAEQYAKHAAKQEAMGNTRRSDGAYKN